ncbi:thioredoxin family protein [Leeuwenhoekiella marinoflava]|uniref:Thioredoxin 1 n=2 Tax=Leeuwenhoekiella marinoflava TaxID=988 RepID=A0A4Q0PMA8_9FLAO|nr:thioredoxin family protein [Leeuwenhoekiella marinoflava]RXG31619.1 thioredoxin 1 [Leeuwenhoekiella marinoflava]SHF10734.1 thioredoxin 1 [Leeuwenhoekiella marinoflava DSM 3653]
MSKFGALIDQDVPVLLDFYTESDERSAIMNPILRDVAAALGDQVKVVKIDINKNLELAEALRIKGLPTLVIYKKGEMKWRQSGEQDAQTLITVFQKFI